MGNCIRTDSNQESNIPLPQELPHWVLDNVSKLKEKNRKLSQSIDQTNHELELEKKDKLEYKRMLEESNLLIERWIIAYSLLKRERNKMVRENQVLKYQMRDMIKIFTN